MCTFSYKFLLLYTCIRGCMESYWGKDYFRPVIGIDCVEYVDNVIIVMTFK